MEIQTKYKVIISVVTVVTAFAIGRYTVPEKVRVETKIVEVKSQDTKKKDDVQTVVVVKKEPDGEETTTTTTLDKTTTDTISHVAENEDTISTKSSGTQPITISVLGGVDTERSIGVIGGSITKPVLGPVTLGIFGLSNGTCGGSIGLTF